MGVLKQVIELLCVTLQLPPHKNILNESSMLLGAIPEFDSMAVVSVINALEEQYGFVVDDDEIDADVFETVGTLVKFIELKLNY